MSARSELASQRAEAVWAAAYAARFNEDLREHLSLNDWPEDEDMLRLAGEAASVADAAVEALGFYVESLELEAYALPSKPEAP